MRLKRKAIRDERKERKKFYIEAKGVVNAHKESTLRY